MTAEDMLQDSLKISHFYNDKYDRMCCFSDDVQLAMQEYAKLKCQELLEIVSEKAELDWEKFSNYDSSSCEIDKDSILNAVDLGEFIV